jgi:hypothetical protein
MTLLITGLVLLVLAILYSALTQLFQNTLSQRTPSPLRPVFDSIDDHRPLVVCTGWIWG